MTEKSKTESELYADRNALAVAFCDLLRRHNNLLRALGEPSVRDYRACWSEPDADDADAAEWALLYGWLPDGQVSWHVPRDLAEMSAISRKSAGWDGHDRTEKNDRLREFAGAPYYSPL